MQKRTLRVRTVFNGKSPDTIVRQLAPLLVLLFVFTAFSGCIGGSDASWGTDDGQYSVIIGDADNPNSTIDMSVNNKLSSSVSNHISSDEDLREIIGCENSTYSISGWLTQTKVFDQPLLQS